VLVEAVPVRSIVVETGAFSSDLLLGVHQAMLRIGAARGDVMAVLSLPRHFREKETIDHLQTLLGGVSQRRVDQSHSGAVLPLMRPGEERVFGYGACFHPWVWTYEPDGAGQQTRAVSPDGVACGQMAVTALRRGAWIAPANVPLKGVVALEPALDDAAWAQFWDKQLNLIRLESRGFLTLSAETLSRDNDTRPISVRRLLMLLRRLAWREGMQLVFAPNHPRLQATVKRKFDLVLTELFVRGAFAGDTPAEGFQVVLPPGLNDAGARDAGRLVVDLKIAPSMPLTFLTVRLVQEGGKLSIQAEV
jgi:phage tail sheath protein FI